MRDPVKLCASCEAVASRLKPDAIVLAAIAAVCDPDNERKVRGPSGKYWEER